MIRIPGMRVLGMRTPGIHAGHAVLTLGLAMLPALAALGALPAPSRAAETKAGAIVVTDPWARATPGGAKVGGGYLTITNTGTEPDRLLGGSFPRASRVEVHEMAVENGVMHMRPLKDGLAIDPGRSVTLAPGGYHLMFMGLKEPLREGETLTGELRFEKAGAMSVPFAVRSIGAGARAATGAGGHGGMSGGMHGDTGGGMQGMQGKAGH
ncbi:Copper metallochaperone [Rhodovulum sp. PH10]|uniref:copper chaperone PCu(A)C n=1 Tax=Rhodovulum sp. PH10 TaxID=1187851 RepID=UPI00027C265F|nr:copper chaperone PCu(A)C [Rhodovulum sp. PH10]EJW11831.1 Copper metallochaperone [Rhodovulum sp. PH10]